MRRTQHAVSSVFPSVGIVNGLRNVAIRVSPVGKLLTFPSGTHERYPFSRPRVMEERRKRASGTAKTIAAIPLNRIPSFIKNPRREIVASVDGAITGFVDIFISPGAAHNSKRNKAGRGSARGATPARQLHQ